MAEPRRSRIRVSTIIPVYNGAATVGAAISSALAQAFHGQEIIVVDDGSTDATGEMLAAYGDQIRVFHQTNQGPAAARNAGIAFAQGEYIALLDSDDLWLPSHLGDCVAVLDSDPSAVGCLASFIPLVGGEKLPPRTFSRSVSLDLLLAGEAFVLPSALVARRAETLACGGFPAGFTHPGFEDTCFFLSLAERGLIRSIPEPGVVYAVPVFGDVSRKYAPGFRRFAQYASQRYGARAETLIRNSREALAASFLTFAIERSDAGQPRQALAALRQLILLDPIYLLKRIGLRRILLGRNLRRAGGIAGAPFKRRAACDGK